ncbi:MAG TPA: tRNA preQ1(34) S-adenosylmethionine ribosyltransferase-isomerase QueA [Candidatus Hydrogenedens sp.]|nr:tRNA preQ1(34) S-adenosylmethionine ribosyltransferase-isomerase QueA [Candidatus Hydrogenedens sp.]HPP58486.1 tRNA preQ1(34) S-adenosylmethionine ribosyltransferase-isomerase QueA [Candidatus Hydrogenedens sp.]
MLTEELNYYLPEHLIAQQPVRPRDSSRLLVVSRETKKIKEDIFRNLPNYLLPGDVIVLNNTKVIPARLMGYKEKTGGKVEVFLLKQIDDYDWIALVRPSAKVAKSTKVVFHPELTCEVLDFLGEGKRLVRFPKSNIMSLIKKVGLVPLPHYIHRDKPDPKDILRYQTIFAQKSGSVAAPTAGLHYTNRVFKKLQQKGIDICFVTLHVGYGTFKPITSEKLEQHILDQEEYFFSEQTAMLLNEKRKKGNRIVAVGTTVTRVLETQYKNGQFFSGSGYTNKYIYPPYTFKAIDILQTNFHLPKSSLLALVFAFAGKELIMQAYQYAIEHNFRFYSYGDTMLIL